MLPLIARDLKHIWHPCTQMKTFETYPPLVVHGAKGVYLYTDKGPLIDAISSWWSKSLGHGHPLVLEAIKTQMAAFEHVIAVNTTHQKLVDLGEKLAALSPQKHLSFASDGACAVEIAMKMAIHAHQIKGNPLKREFIALKNAYHGETLATLAVSDLGLYKAPYQGFGPDCHFIEDIPWVNTPDDPLWTDAACYFDKVQKKLDPIADKVSAILVEPIVQGAAGMRLYAADFLHRLAAWAKQKDIYLIADEIMTGLCRTGQWFASTHAGVNPDLICLSKGLTSGTMPLSVVLADEAIYALFYGEDNLGFYHSHTYSAHALGVAAAVATLDLMDQEDINDRAKTLQKWMFDAFQQIATATNALDNLRGIGGIVAADLKPHPNPKVGVALYQKAIEQGALLRPIGKTLYWLPPLNTDKQTIDNLAEITLHCLRSLYC